MLVIGLVVGLSALYFFMIKKNLLEAMIALLFGGGLFFVLYLAWDQSSGPVLILNENGITDRRLGVGLILWADIIDVQIESRYNNQFICLRVSDPEKYISRLSGAKLANMRHSQKIGFTMLNIDVNSFDIDPLEMMEYVRKTSAQGQKLKSKI